MEADEGVCTASERSVVIIPPVEGNELSQDEIHFLNEVTSNRQTKKRKHNKKKRKSKRGGGKKGRLIHETTLDDIIMEEKHLPIDKTDIIESVNTLANDSLATIESSRLDVGGAKKKKRRRNRKKTKCVPPVDSGNDLETESASKEEIMNIVVSLPQIEITVETVSFISLLLLFFIINNRTELENFFFLFQ